MPKKGIKCPKTCPKKKNPAFSQTPKSLSTIRNPIITGLSASFNICPKTAFLFFTMLEGNLFYPLWGKVAYPPPPQNLFSKPSPSMGPQSFVSFPLKRISAPPGTITGNFPQSPSKALSYKHLRGFPGNKKRP